MVDPMTTRSNQISAAKTIIKKLKRPDIQLCRKLIQYLFLATVVLIGIKFTIFVSQLENAMVPTGNWQTGISDHEYLFHLKNLDMPFYQHNRGQMPAYNKEAWLRMINKVRQAGDRRHQ